MRRRLGILAVLVVLAGCAGGVDAPSAPPAGLRAAGPAARAEDFLVVDCLLPGQIRQLGTRATVVMARRAVKTSGRNCEILGGEYVAYDRATRGSSLRVWMALAEQGDTKAQTYVGEIFEKGFGEPPDYASAAQWYRRAADAGYGPAMVNLGNLHEQGLGVPRDAARARALFQRAGVPGLSFDPQQGAEMERLRLQVAQLERQLAAKQQELDKTQRELATLRGSLDQRRRESDQERDTLARLRRELEESRQRERVAASGQREQAAAAARALEQQVAEREGRLAAKDKEVADLRASLAKLEAASGAHRAELDRLKKQQAEAPPDIQLIEPELIAFRGPDLRAAKLPSAQAKQLLMVGKVNAGAGLTSFTINGREEKLDANNMFKAAVPVPAGEERFRLVAVDRAGRKSTLEFVAVEPARAVAATSAAERIGAPLGTRIDFGRYHALVIGNNEYKSLRRLRTAVNDANEVARILQRDYGFKVTLLTNANRYDTLSALNTLREQLTDADNLLIYYAGHGELDQVNQRGHWLPVDAEPGNTANWISNVTITDILNAMTVKQLLVVADSCYSGTLTRSSGARLAGGMSDEEARRVIQRMVEKRSRMVMTSGGVAPVLDSAGGRHSVFAEQFLELLRGNSGLLLGQEMFQHLQRRVTAGAQRRVEASESQLPEYAPIKYAGHESGDFVFVRSASAR